MTCWLKVGWWVDEGAYLILLLLVLLAKLLHALLDAGHGYVLGQLMSSSDPSIAAQ